MFRWAAIVNASLTTMLVRLFEPASALPDAARAAFLPLLQFFLRSSLWLSNLLSNEGTEKA